MPSLIFARCASEYAAERELCPAAICTGAKTDAAGEELPDAARVIAREADLLLKVRVDREPDEFNMLATSSTLAVIAVFDAICIALMKYMDYSKEQFAVIHPSGAVGDRLLGKEK